MALNINLSDLDWNQALKRTVDSTADAIRTIPAETTSFSIELDSADGDSVTTHPASTSGTASVTNATLANAEIIAPIAADGMKTIDLYAKCTTAITSGGTPSAKIQISPASSGDVWVDLPSGSLNLPTTLNTVSKLALPLSLCALRMRVLFGADTITTGDATIYMVAQKV